MKTTRMLDLTTATGRCLGRSVGPVDAALMLLASKLDGARIHQKQDAERMASLFAGYAEGMDALSRELSPVVRKPFDLPRLYDMQVRIGEMATLGQSFADLFGAFGLSVGSALLALADGKETLARVVREAQSKANPATTGMYVLRGAILRGDADLADVLAKYEATGDHDHGRGTIAPGGPCPGGDCLVAQARRKIAEMDREAIAKIDSTATKAVMIRRVRLYEVIMASTLRDIVHHADDVAQCLAERTTLTATEAKEVLVRDIGPLSGHTLPPRVAGLASALAHAHALPEEPEK